MEKKKQTTNAQNKVLCDCGGKVVLEPMDMTLYKDQSDVANRTIRMEIKYGKLSVWTTDKGEGVGMIGRDDVYMFGVERIPVDRLLACWNLDNKQQLINYLHAHYDHSRATEQLRDFCSVCRIPYEFWED